MVLIIMVTHLRSLRQPLSEIFCPAARHHCLIFRWGNAVSLTPNSDKSWPTLNCSRIISCCWCCLYPCRLWDPTGRDWLLSLPPSPHGPALDVMGAWSVGMSRLASGVEDAAALSLIFQMKLQPSSSGMRTEF